LESYKKKFPYICNNCGKFTRTYSEYCENCGTYSSIRNTNDNDYTEENIMRQSEHKTIRSIPEEVLFTVKSFNEDVQKGKKLGADAYNSKPFSGKKLLNRIKKILDK
ncbi:MAG: hypothetical protein ACFFBF_15580, partial [Promethearchaeota archaeon]